MEDEGTVFKEAQRFRQPWLFALMIGLIAIMTWGFVQQILLGVPWGDNPAPDWMMVMLFIIFGILFPAFIFSLGLFTEVTSSELRIRFRPLQVKGERIPLKDIAEHASVDYRPLREFGGWGIRYGPTGKAYNVSGTRGVRLRTVEGREILIGSWRADELDAAIGRGRINAAKMGRT